MRVLETICVPIFGNSPESMSKTLESLPPQCSLVELRIDSLDEPSIEAISQALQNWPHRCIITCRLPQDGGMFKGDIAARNALLQNCLLMDDFCPGGHYVDIEIEHCLSKEFDLSSCSHKAIISHHDFDKTPSVAELDTLLEKMLPHQPVACKFATNALCEQDSLRLYQFLQKHQSMPTKLIVIAMGEHGRQSRIIAPFLGSFVSYARPLGLDSPPELGQCSVDAMIEIFAAISN